VTSDFIVICPHLNGGELDIGTQVIHVEGGKVLTATCFDCADLIDAPGADISIATKEFKAICPEHAQLRNIPTQARLADGFYEWEDGHWVKQPDDLDEVN
jgi:hypothetical protein